MVEVAAHARVDPALVRYYFGDKKGVLHAAAKRLLDQVQDRGQVLLAGEGTFEQRVRQRLEALIGALEDHPRFMQLVIQEVYAVDADSAPDAVKDLQTVADRGLAGRVGDAEWAAVCRAVEAGIARDGIEPAVVEGVRQISDLLARHFPADGAGRDELPDRPVVL